MHGYTAIDVAVVQHFFHFFVHFVFIRNLNGSKFFVFSSADEGNINTSVSSQNSSFNRVCFAMFASQTCYSDSWSSAKGASFKTSSNVHESFGNHFFDLCHNDLLIPFRFYRLRICKIILLQQQPAGKQRNLSLLYR